MTTPSYSSPRTLLIDADIIAYQASASNEKRYDWGDGITSHVADFEKAKQDARETIDALVAKLDATDVVVCLSDDFNNWRKGIYPPYKTNRNETVRPEHLYDMKEWLGETYPTDLRPRLEADDVMGILSTEPHKGDRIIVSQDKDMQTVPGLLFNPNKDTKVGARCINNLAAWLLVTLFPPDQHFARLSIHEDTAAELGEDLSTAKEALNRIAGKAHLLIDTSMCRPIFMEALRHLIVAGNCLLYFALDGGAPRMFRIDQYVCLRDERGGLLEAVVFEKVYPSTLDEATLAACKVSTEGVAVGTTDLVEFEQTGLLDHQLDALRADADALLLRDGASHALALEELLDR